MTNKNSIKSIISKKGEILFYRARPFDTSTNNRSYQVSSELRLDRLNQILNIKRGKLKIYVWSNDDIWIEKDFR